MLADTLSVEFELQVPQIPRTLLYILAALNNVAVLIVSTRSLISKFSNPLSKYLVTVSRTPTTIGITATFPLHNLLIPMRGQVTYPSFCFFQFYSVVSQESKVHNSAISLSFLLIIIRSGRLAEIRWSVSISKSQSSLCVSFSRKYARLCIYDLFVWLYFNVLHSSRWITFPNQLCLVLYFFWVSLLNSLILWFIVLSL